MFEGFEAAEIEAGDATIFVRRRGSGPPALLLHGFPQTHLMWRGVAPMLASSFTVVCADLRGDDDWMIDDLLSDAAQAGPPAS